MIILKDEHYIAEGLIRKCYHHPNDTNLCVKIGKKGVDKYVLYKEIEYFHRIRNKDISKFDYPFYAKFFGEIETNLGIGFVYELIKDEKNQKISLTLRDYLEMETSPFSDAILAEALNRMKEHLIKHKIFISDLKARNLCCKVLEDNSIELIIIDGLGHRDFLPFADYISYFAKKKVERRFEKSAFTTLDEQRKLLKSLRDAGVAIV